MKNFWSKFKFSIIIIGYIALVIVFAYFLIMPMISNIKALSYQVQSKSIDREIEKKQIEKLPEMMSEWSGYENQAEKLNVILSQQDQVSFIENIESIAQISGNEVTLKIEDNSGDAPARGRDATKKFAYPDYLSINIDLEGNYDGLVNFIHLLENSQFYVNILSFSSVKNTLDENSNTNIFGDSAPNRVGDESVAQSDFIKTTISAIVYIKKQ